MKTKIGMLFLAMSAFFFGSLFPAPAEAVKAYIWMTSIFYAIGLFLIVNDVGSDIEPKNLTLEEFDNMTFSQVTEIEYKGKKYEVVLVNFDEKLFGLKEEEGIYWVRAENCKLLNS